ncbi:MAG: cyclic nucleotide-binding domain-containing protein [Spirochaetales bacterium]|nr:cyclic nucleotide-binding domain-containing protein [Spirochaetales bacterium]
MKNGIDLSELLKKAEIFAGLDPESLALISQKLDQVYYKRDDVICRDGDPGEEMFVIVTGEVAVTKQGPGGAEVEITVLRSGEVAGVMSLFDEDVRSATLRAKGNVELFRLDKNTFQEILSRNVDLARRLLAHLSRQLRSETRTVAQLLSPELDRRLKAAVFDTKPYTREAFEAANRGRFALHYFEPRLGLETAFLCSGFKAVCAFVNDDVSRPVLEELKRQGVELIALRCAGFNNVDVEAARDLGLSVTRVPAYSPHAVAEHAAALLLALNRKINRAYNRVREGNFSLSGLVGFDLFGKTAGIVGVGKIGKCLTAVLRGFGMTVLGHDALHDEEFASASGLAYVSLEELLSRSDVISLHAPLMTETRHLINGRTIGLMKPGVILINTSRGALIDTAALIEGLKAEKIGAAGLDVYEEEEGYFFEDRSDRIITDDVLARLMTFNNVIITSHQAFLTREALAEIARVTLESLAEFESGRRLNELTNAVLPKSGASKGGGKPNEGKS